MKTWTFVAPTPMPTYRQTACKRARCQRCRRKDLKTVPFRRDSTTRVVALCPTCSHAEER
jgi:hypothetical protein